MTIAELIERLEPVLAELDFSDRGHKIGLGRFRIKAARDRCPTGCEGLDVRGTASVGPSIYEGHDSFVWSMDLSRFNRAEKDINRLVPQSAWHSSNPPRAFERENDEESSIPRAACRRLHRAIALYIAILRAKHLQEVRS